MMMMNETREAINAGMSAWIFIERQHGPHVFVGPFPSSLAAEAHEESAQVNALCEEDCLNLVVTDEEGKEQLARDVEFQTLLPESPSFLHGIDWPALREQKASLLSVLDELDDDLRQSEDGGLYAERTRGVIADLNGILNLIDSMQDHAADELGVPGVFDPM